MNKLIILNFLLGVLFTSCSLLKDSPKYQLADGYYRSNIFKKKSKKVYVYNEEESIRVYPLKKKDGTNSFVVDTSKKSRLSFPQFKSDSLLKTHSFTQGSFDIDFLTLPFKCRFSTHGFPPQFNSSLLNGAVYLGYRTDMYRLKYKSNPFRQFIRQKNHYGFSIGAFSGLGGTTMNPWVTKNQISYEYDGIAWSKGISAIVAIDNFTVGLAVGWDNLLDHNEKYWIYQGQPWLGLAFGLNLN